MRRLILFPFKLFKWLEDFFGAKGLGRIPWVRSAYSPFHKLMFNLQYRWMCDILKLKGIALIDVQGNKMYVDTRYRDNRDIVPHLLLDGVWEKYETELFKQMVKEGMVVVDIGANVGYYTLIGAKLVGKSGVVYAFEPEPSNYELLYQNIEVNGYTNVVPVQKAVSNKRGKAKLWVNELNSAYPSLSEDNVLGKTGFVEVETTTLDEFFEDTVKNIKVDFIKIDTQGTEGLILDGAEKILRSNNLKILMEFWPDGLRNVGTDPLRLLYKLQEYGFTVKRINERKQALESTETDEFRKGAITCIDLLLEK